MSNWRPGAIAVSRRDALATMVGAGFVVMVAGAGAAQAEASAQTPKQGGRIRVASLSSSTADTLDPAKGALSTDYVRHYMFYNGLTQYDGRLQPKPALAESIDTNDRTVWFVKLRKGVIFHDGAPLTARDVAYSLLRHKIPAVGSKAVSVAVQFKDVKAISPLELQIRLTGPNTDLPSILAASHFLVIKDGTTDFETAIGTGPYTCKEFRPGIRTVGARNTNYWKPGQPHLDEIELIGIPDEVSRVNALLSGDVQLINWSDPRSIRRMRSSPRVEVQEIQSGLYTDLVMRQDVEPTNDPNFVMAMKYLFDRDLIRKAVFLGFSTLANDHPIPPTNPYYLADIPQRVYDPDRAKYLLNKAGLLDVRLPIYASPAAEESVDIASVLQESAAKIGFKLAVNRVPPDGYWSTHWMKHPLTFGNSNPRPTADLIFSQLYKSDAPWNESGWKNEQFDQLLLAARGEADEAKRKQMYGDMQVLVHDHCGVGIPVFMHLMDAYDQRLKGYVSNPLGCFMGYMFSEYVWLDG